MTLSLRLVLGLCLGIALSACKTRTIQEMNEESRAKMDLSSSAECDNALLDVNSFLALSPASEDDFKAAAEVCQDATPGSGAEGVADESGKSLCEAAATASQLALKGDAFVRWSSLASVPLTMSCRSFRKLGASNYGRKAYQQVDRVFLRSLLASESNPTAAVDSCAFSQPVPDVQFLSFVNGLMPVAIDEDLSTKSNSERIEYLDSKFALRKTSPRHQGLRKSEVYQAIPMSDAEIKFLKEEWSDGTMRTELISKPFMSYDVTPPAMVSGTFAFHTPRASLCAKLQDWQADAMKLAQTESSGNAIEKEVARLTRSCIAIHPFSDGNGRSCGLWSVHALARAGKTPSMRWPHEDYSVPLSDYTNYFLTGMENASKLALSLK